MDPTPRPPSAPIPRRGPRGRDAAFHFSSGEVLSTSFRIFGRHLPILLLLATAFHAVPALLELARAKEVAETVRAMMEDRAYPGSLDLLGGPLGLASMFAGWVLPLAFQAVVTFAVFQALRGGTPRWGESVGKGVQRLLHALGASLLVYLGIGLPVFLIMMVLAALGGVPGALLGGLGALVFAVILACTWYVTIQVAVVEAKNPFTALSRSGRLTSGARGSILAIVLVVYVLPAMLLKLVLRLMLGEQDLEVVDTTRIFVQTGFGVFFGGLQAVTAVVVYHVLRRAKEGVGLDELLAVFD